jgi:hypothetical protein
MDSYVLSQIFSYLHNCCKQVDEMISNIDYAYKQKDGYVTSPLFMWENIRKGGPDNEKLRKFLKSQFKWDWLDNARITKTEDDNTIDRNIVWNEYCSHKYGQREKKSNFEVQRKKGV